MLLDELFFRPFLDVAGQQKSYLAVGEPQYERRIVRCSSVS